MGKNLCKIKIKTDGQIETKCKKKPQVVTVKSETASLEYVPRLNARDQKYKDQIIRDILTKAQQCYMDEGPDNCTVPVKLKVFKMDKCPACQTHLPKIQDRIQRMRHAGISVHDEVVTVRNQSHAVEMQEAGCIGTPCVIVEHAGDRKKVSEGRDSDLQFYSQLFNIKNPLYNDGVVEAPHRFRGGI